jgi:hypothetical protein
MNEKQISIDQDGPHLIMMPLDPMIAGRLFVVGQSGKLYTLLFKVAAPADDRVEVTATAPKTHAKVQPFTIASFLRALRIGAEVPGMQAVDVPAPSIADTRLSVVSVSAVTLGPTIGLVLAVRNTQPTPLTLDVRVGIEQEALGTDKVALSLWVWPPKHTIRAIAAEDEVLGVDGQTRVYAVLERRP